LLEIGQSEPDKAANGASAMFAEVIEHFKTVRLVAERLSLDHFPEVEQCGERALSAPSALGWPWE